MSKTSQIHTTRRALRIAIVWKVINMHVYSRGCQIYFIIRNLWNMSYHTVFIFLLSRSWIWLPLLAEQASAQRYREQRTTTKLEDLVWFSLILLSDPLVLPCTMVTQSVNYECNCSGIRFMPVWKPSARELYRPAHILFAITIY